MPGCCLRGVRSFASSPKATARWPRIQRQASRRRNQRGACPPRFRPRKRQSSCRSQVTTHSHCAIARLFELAYSSGLRLSEIAHLDLAGCDLAGGEVRVLGKGSKERVVPVGAAARDAISRWLTTAGRHAAANEQAMFIGRHGRRLSPRAIQQRLGEWAIRQGLSRHVHPHMLRHSFASHVLQSSGDLRAVQEMLGHASIASTQVYTHLDFQALAKVYDAAHPRAKRKRAK